MKRLLEAYLNLHEQGIEITPKQTSMGIGLLLTDKRTGHSMFLLEQFKENVRPLNPIEFDLDEGLVIKQLPSRTPSKSKTLLEQYREGNIIALRKLMVSLNPIVTDIIEKLRLKYGPKNDSFLKLTSEKELPTIIALFKGGEEELEEYVRAQLIFRLEMLMSESKKKKGISLETAKRIGLLNLPNHLREGRP